MKKGIEKVVVYKHL